MVMVKGTSRKGCKPTDQIGSTHGFMLNKVKFKTEFMKMIHRAKIYEDD
jgi:hypothetical protein